MISSTEMQLLCFTLNSDAYAIDINRVEEIRAIGQLRKLPNMPEHCTGVIDFRSNMVPVIDLRKLFNYQHHSIELQTVMIVLSVHYNNNELLIGIIVDSVSDVLTITPEQVKAAPNFGNKIDVSFMQGMFKHDDHLYVLLTLEAVFGEQNMAGLQQFTELVDSQQ